MGQWESDGTFELRKRGEKESVSWIRQVAEALDLAQLQGQEEEPR